VTTSVDGPTKPQKTALLLAQRIVRSIDQKGLGPGDKLPPERIMMEMYDAGRGTLRESLRYLELQGVLSFKPGPGGGPVIVGPDASNLATMLTLMLQFEHAPYRVIAEARQALEPLMAEHAAARITADQLADLQQSLADMEAGIQDLDAYLESNRRFHEVIARASDNSLFGFLVEVMVGPMEMSTQGIEYPVRRRNAVLAAHREIFEAIRDGKTERAGETMRTHVAEYTRYADRKYPTALDKLIKW
jgi:GntR family transcriptional regulator, transcriptional repressor for pyruvate dehydrogenase complex